MVMVQTSCASAGARIPLGLAVLGNRLARGLVALDGAGYRFRGCPHIPTGGWPPKQRDELPMRDPGVQPAEGAIFE